jgi:O-antigen ligase
MSIARIERLLLSALVFSIPLGTGIIYNPVVKEDLIFLSDVILGMLYFLWLFRVRKTGVEFGRLALPGLLVIIWSVVSMVNAIALQASMIGIFFSIKALLLYVYLVNNINTRAQVFTVMNAFVFSVLLQSCIGLTQKAVGRDLGLYVLGELPYDYARETARIRGTIGFPNQYGAFMIQIMPLVIALAFFVKKKLFKRLYLITSIFGMSALFFTLSRSSWAGFFLGLVCFALLLTRRGLLKPKYLAGFAGIFMVIGIIAAVKWGTIERRMAGGSDGTHRFRMIEIATGFIKDNPITGVGLNNYEWHNRKHFNFWQPVHNEFLRFASETGVPGFLFFVWVIVTFLRQSYQLVLNRDTLWTIIGMAGFCGMMAFIIAINIGPQYQHYRIQQAFWAMGGLVFAAERLRKIEQQRKLKRKKIERMQTQKGAQVVPVTQTPRPTGAQRRESNESTDDRQVFLRKGWS